MVHVSGGSNSQRGTWIHPRLAIDVARWVSPSFGVKIIGWTARFIAGDVSLMKDVQARIDEVHKTQSLVVHTIVDRKESSADLATLHEKGALHQVESVRNDGGACASGVVHVDSREKKLQLDLMEVNIEQKRVEIDRQRQEIDAERIERTWKLLNLCGDPTECEKIFIKDLVKTAAKRGFRETSMEIVESHKGPKQPRREIEISGICNVMGITYKQKLAGTVGKRMLKLWRQKHNKQPEEYPPKRHIVFDGHTLEVNGYFTEDTDIMEQAIREVYAEAEA